jgi:hypothetical protein
MPILIKKINGGVISYFGGDNNDFSAKIHFVRRIEGKAGVEDYILLPPNFEAFTQDFSSVIETEFCETSPNNYGLNTCSIYTNVNISF